ncbi:MAG: site-2 protease family protein [Armatimonadota bacterium]
MFNNILWIPALIFLLGVLVLFHEFGHFAVAKLLKIRVEEFAFGFGPKWIRLFKRGDTEYTIHPYPLGGFVKLAGAEPGEEDMPDGFNSKPWWKRYLVYLAGPFMSFALAYIIFCALGFTIGLPITGDTMNKVDLIEPNSEAERAGIKVGDVIVSINNKPINNGRQMLDTVHNSPDKLLNITVKRNDNYTNISAVPQPRVMLLKSLGFSASRPTKGENIYRIDQIEKKSEGNRVGLKNGDGIISINGVKPASAVETVDMVKKSAGKEMVLVVDRKDQMMKFRLTPDEKLIDKDQVVAFLGFIPKQRLERVGLLRSIKFGNDTTVAYAKTMVVVLFSKEVKDAVGGPISIANETQNGLKRGTYGFLQLMAALSLSLGVFNLMPIPVVDGGQMVLLVAEGIKGRRLSRRTLELAQLAGLLIIGAIFVLVMTLDVGRIVSGKIFR